ncbi:Lrp/AsnC family transcriptional regulator [Streptomyces sp. NPDC002573]|uniref:Lrp/AsnC family transcriptional regulator n=1 Tax=Streptomyces sp. NPDC002573 TaxID=3364651 RepID=UPI00368FD393
MRGDGRLPLNQLAAETGVAQSTVQRRIADLRDSGVLYFDIDTDRARLGLPIRTQLWLTLPPTDLAATGRALARQAEVAFAAAITGTRNLYASVSTPSVPGFYEYLTNTVSGLPAVESSLVLHTVKGPAGIRSPGTDR